MPIYTRTGDKGKTSLFDGSRVLKSDIRVEAYGTVDELNSMIGAAIAELQRAPQGDWLRGSGAKSKEQRASVRVKNELQKIQHDLLDIGSVLATPAALPVEGLGKRSKEFEKLIDRLTGKMPELKNFILPGGRRTGALLHVARTVSRRAERRVVALAQDEEVDTHILIYLNRLSDLFFTLARYVNFVEKEKETMWMKK